ncbi:recombinase family protein [Clostridium celatum]|uniref:recombinase family protein n=1 Tax=Clostridium celatum TaxID=36834 RepID=UPI0018978DC0|nr:recombinase family protein [Clostridium celatum]
MAIYGYTRISTNSTKQDNTRQIKGIMEYLKTRNLSTDIQFFNDEITGKTFKRPAFDNLKDVVVAGDEVVIYQLDRLGRKKEGIKEALQWFKERGIIVRVLDMPTTLQDFTGMDSGLAKTIMEVINNLMIEMAGAFAEAEAERISSRVKEGMAIAKEKGKQIGNTKKTKNNLPDNFEYYYELIQNKTLKKKDVAGILSVGEATLWRYCKLYEGTDVYSKNAESMKNKRENVNPVER